MIKLNKILLAKIISYIFIPPVMNLFIFWYLFDISNEPNKVVIIISSAIFGFILPILFFVFMRRKGKIMNDDATEKSQRTIPYIFALLFSLLAYFVVELTGNFSNASKMWLVYLFSSLIIIPINIYWKISAHALGVSIPFAYLMYSGSMFSLPFIFVIILVFISRLILKVHTPMQLIAGAFVGIIVTNIVYLF